MGGVAAGGRASERLLGEKEALARAVTQALYEEMPELVAKHGARGREKCLQDMRYNLEHLAPAVELAEPAMFAGYVRWLDGLLRARGVATEEVARSLELTTRVVRARFPAEEAEAVELCVRAGLAELPAGEGAR